MDHNDSTAITTVEQRLQYGSKVKTSLLKPTYWVYYRFHPTVQHLIYSGLASGYAVSNRHNSFVHKENLSVPHYGLKYCLGVPGANTFICDIFLEIQYKFNITCLFSME